MWKQGAISMAVLAALAATPARADPAGDWAFFLDNSYSQHSEADENSWEDQLFREGETYGRGEAVARWASQVGLPGAAAERYADAIIRSVVARETCVTVSACDFSPGGEWSRSVLQPALEEPTGELLWVIGQNIGSDPAPISPAIFSALIDAHPRRTELLARLYRYSGRLPFLVALVVEDPRDPTALAALRSSGAGVDGGPINWDGGVLAVLEDALGRLANGGAEPAEQAVYAQAILARYFQLGLTDEGLATWRAYSPALKAELPLQFEGCAARSDSDDCVGLDASEVLSNGLLAALWLDGDRTGAEAWLAQVERRMGDSEVWSAFQEHAALREGIRRSVPDADLFDLYTAGAPRRVPVEDHSLSGEGWLFQRFDPATRTIVSQRARDAGYPSIAETIATREPYYRDADSLYDGNLDEMASILTHVADRRAELRAAIDAAWTAQGGDFNSRRQAPEPAKIPVAWIESALPAGVPTWIEPEEPAPAAVSPVDASGLEAVEAALPEEVPEAELSGEGDPALLDGGDDFERDFIEAPALDLPAGLEAPVHPAGVVRIDRNGDDVVLLYQSAEYDLPGEIPAFGLWLIRTENGGWTEPVYLGLQQYFPYVATPASALPMVESGRVRIEVQVREIDPRTITFPPVGLGYLRREDGRVIEASLTDLVRDTDGDRLTDIAEDRLGLDSENPDIDGDGLPDGTDPVPLASGANVSTPARQALALAILKQVVGYEAAAIVVAPREVVTDELDVLSALGESPPHPASALPRTVILVGDPTLFAGLDLPFRLLVYTPEQARGLATGAPFYPPSISVYSSLDQRRHLVEWSASWVGGQFLVTCPDNGGACEVQVKQQWIT
ncbi:hypothetical protein [Brevundimonas sp.]|uniref:hypothetical protein n=1 Tax=Brevundimonas sp. TaxID=1871086 RepID=UPI002EDA228E